MANNRLRWCGARRWRHFSQGFLPGISPRDFVGLCPSWCQGQQSTDSQAAPAPGSPLLQWSILASFPKGLLNPAPSKKLKMCFKVPFPKIWEERNDLAFSEKLTWPGREDNKMELNILLLLQRGNQANKGKNNFKIPKSNGMFLHWLGLLSFTTGTTASKSLQVTLKHEQVDGWHSGRAADGKDCA